MGIRSHLPCSSASASRPAAPCSRARPRPRARPSTADRLAHRLGERRGARLAERLLEPERRGSDLVEERGRGDARRRADRPARARARPPRPPRSPAALSVIRSATSWERSSSRSPPPADLVGELAQPGDRDGVPHDLAVVDGALGLVERKPRADVPALVRAEVDAPAGRRLGGEDRRHATRRRRRARLRRQRSARAPPPAPRRQDRGRTMGPWAPSRHSRSSSPRQSAPPSRHPRRRRDAAGPGSYCRRVPSEKPRPRQNRLRADPTEEGALAAVQDDCRVPAGLAALPLRRRWRGTVGSRRTLLGPELRGGCAGGARRGERRRARATGRTHPRRLALAARRGGAAPRRGAPPRDRRAGARASGELAERLATQRRVEAGSPAGRGPRARRSRSLTTQLTRLARAPEAADRGSRGADRRRRRAARLRHARSSAPRSRACARSSSAPRSRSSPQSTRRARDARADRRRALHELGERLRRRERELGRADRARGGRGRARVQAGLGDIERRAVEQLERRRTREPSRASRRPPRSEFDRPRSRRARGRGTAARPRARPRGRDVRARGARRARRAALPGRRRGRAALERRIAQMPRASSASATSASRRSSSG